MIEPPAPVILPCGCLVECEYVDGVPVTRIVTCSAGENCPNVRFSLGYAAAIGVPIEKRRL